MDLSRKYFHYWLIVVACTKKEEISIKYGESDITKIWGRDINQIDFVHGVIY